MLVSQTDPPMSYLMIKRQLQEEFGEDIWLRNKDDVKRILRKKTMQKEIIKRTGSTSGVLPKLRSMSSHGVEKEMFHIFRGDSDFDSHMKVLSVKDDGRTVYLNRPGRSGGNGPLNRILIILDESALAYPKVNEKKYHIFKTKEKELLFSCIPSYPHLSHFNIELAKCMQYIMRKGLKPNVVDVLVMERSESRRIRKENEGGDDAECWAAALDSRTRQYFYIHRTTRKKTWVSPFTLQTKEWAQHTDENGFVYVVLRNVSYISFFPFFHNFDSVTQNTRKPKHRKLEYQNANSIVTKTRTQVLSQQAEQLLKMDST